MIYDPSENLMSSSLTDAQETNKPNCTTNILVSSQTSTAPCKSMEGTWTVINLAVT